MNGTSGQIDDEAADWVARMDAGGWTTADEEAVAAWLAGDSARAGALLRAQAAWASLDVPQDELAAGDRPGWRRRDLLATGGGVLAASLAGGALWLRASAAYDTGFGEVRRLALADGSVATMNTASRMEVRLARRTREVTISRGEAWFQVARDAARPFTVAVGDIRVRAVGTAFAVRRTADGADVMVDEGVVEAWSGADAARIRLAAGERAFFADAVAVRVQRPDPAGVERALAWRTGMIELSGETLAEAVDGFNRYNRRKLVLLDARMGGERFDGVFQLSDPLGFAMSVHESLGSPVDASDPAEIRLGQPST